MLPKESGPTSTHLGSACVPCHCMRHWMEGATRIRPGARSSEGTGLLRPLPRATLALVHRGTQALAPRFGKVPPPTESSHMHAQVAGPAS